MDHHLAHAASAYYTSGWPECLVIVIDGMGEAYGASVYLAKDGRLTPVHRIAAADSMGILYSIVTLHLGFDFNSDEYKVMGLAPYGNPGRHGDFFARAVQLREDGGWDIPLLRRDRTAEERQRHGGVREYLTEHLIPPREPESEIRPEHEDVAAGLQASLNQAVVHLCQHFGRRLGQTRLALAGGVALNSTANACLLRTRAFDEIYVQPAAADDGSALGAALARSAAAGEVLNVRSPTPFYGPSSPESETRAALKHFDAQLGVAWLGSLDETCEAAADLIADGKVVGWHRGRMEFGPRALGHRSILADPGRPGIRARVNASVKLREAFRPFAPAVSIEQAREFFDLEPGLELPYMNVNVDVRPAYRAVLPAVTHVDGSGRLQTVSARDNRAFHSLLRAVGRRTGREIVLNTSFNVRG